MRKLSIAATVLALLLASGVIAGCGDDDEESASTTPAATTEATAPATTGAKPAGGEVKVSMKDIKYVPQDVTVNAGQKITWTNDDPVAHTVTAESGADFDSGTIEPGGTYSQTIDKPGKIDYVCTIHPNQTGTITVK